MDDVETSQKHAITVLGSALDGVGFVQGGFTDESYSLPGCVMVTLTTDEAVRLADRLTRESVLRADFLARARQEA